MPPKEQNAPLIASFYQIGQTIFTRRRFENMLLEDMQGTLRSVF